MLNAQDESFGIQTALKGAYKLYVSDIWEVHASVYVVEVNPDLDSNVTERRIIITAITVDEVIHLRDLGLAWAKSSFNQHMSLQDFVDKASSP